MSTISLCTSLKHSSHTSTSAYCCCSHGIKSEHIIHLLLILHVHLDSQSIQKHILQSTIWKTFLSLATYKKTALFARETQTNRLFSQRFAASAHPTFTHCVCRFRASGDFMLCSSPSWLEAGGTAGHAGKPRASAQKSLCASLNLLMFLTGLRREGKSLERRFFPGLPPGISADAGNSNSSCSALDLTCVPITLFFCWTHKEVFGMLRWL